MEKQRLFEEQFYFLVCGEIVSIESIAFDWYEVVIDEKEARLNRICVAGRQAVSREETHRPSTTAGHNCYAISVSYKPKQPTLVPEAVY